MSIDAPRRISPSALESAASLIYDVSVRTPLVRIELPGPLRDRVRSKGGPSELYLKLETLQPIGAFKIRGAYNAVRRLPPERLAEGLWTVSAGNAAQGVALAARQVGARCSILMIDTAPVAKRRAVEALGATIVPAPYTECWRAVEAHASDRMSGHLVHPFDDDDFIAGNGTVGLEIVEDLPDVDAIVASIGGGGLLAGIGAALDARNSPARLYAAEPATAAPLAASLAEGRPKAFEGWQASFVDGAGGRSVLPSMWPLLAPVVRESIVVSLDEVAEAMQLVAERAHVIAEGAGALAVAAALSGRAGRGKVVAVVSGGNIDLSRFATLVGGMPDRRGVGGPREYP